MAEITLTPSLTCMNVIAVAKDAIYLRLPHELQRDCEGGCGCASCKRDPKLAKWDTLVVPIDKRGHSWTVHLPDPAVAGFCEYLARKEKKANG